MGRSNGMYKLGNHLSISMKIYNFRSLEYDSINIYSRRNYSGTIVDNCCLYKSIDYKHRGTNTRDKGT